MTDWLAIIQAAAWSRFCRTGSLEPFLLVRAELAELAAQVAKIPLDTVREQIQYALSVQVYVPVPVIHDRAGVYVDEWPPPPGRGPWYTERT